MPDALETAGAPLEAGPSAATAPPATRVMAASSAAPPPRPARRRRACRAASARRRREALSDASHGPGFAGSMKGTATSWVSVPTGLAVGLALRPALRDISRDSPHGAEAPVGPPFPASGLRRELGLCSVQEGGKDRHITPPNAA